MIGDNGWPDPARPGVPLNPEREGHHWCCVYPNLPFPIVWRHDGIGFRWDNGYSPEQAAQHWRYVGLCLTPAEVAARSAAAAEAMREACAAWCAGKEQTSRSFGSHADAYEIAARNIRALPLPAPGALDRAREEARREGMEAAARYLDAVTRSTPRWGDPAEHAAAIRARMEEGA